MSIWTEIRRQARLRHTELAGGIEDLVPADELLEAAENNTGIKRRPLRPADSLLDGAEAVYDSERKLIYFSNETEPRLAVFYIAHEYAHHWIDGVLAQCRSDDLDLATSAEPEMSLVGDPDAYSPKERAEAQANLFAREFLLPRDKLRRLCQREVFDAERMATDLGVPVDLMMQQLAEALLLPEEREETVSIREEPPPDTSQQHAIEAAIGPHLVRAGPGTGKTRTLIGRVKWLIEHEESPASILVLTFSNFSAQDLSTRIRAAVGERAIAVWVGTFHAFGLEILRKYGVEIGLPVNLRLLDRSGSLMLLEELLPDLALDYYLDLFDPLRKLRTILALTGRAKDELVTPERYAQLADAMPANNNEECTSREKAIEVANAYAVYERAMKKRGFVDFGDLIARPVELFQTRSDILDTVRKEKRHIIVDEYQDMNRASSILLRELVEPGRGPWVVGDVRQSIYRFRGASPINVARFEEDFPGAARMDLGVNYRSGGRIIRTFEAFGIDMKPGNLIPSGELDAYRGETMGHVEFEVASTIAAEGEGIARKILSDVEHGGSFRDHAILARSHTTLARLSRHLERSGVPCLYFGDFFERPEIRDLLSLLSLVSEYTGIGLFRVAQFPQYTVPDNDVYSVFRWRRKENVAMLAALRRLNEIPDLSDAGRAALQRIADDVADANFPMSAHLFLLGYLFRRGDHLQALLADETVTGQQQRLAIYQLLQVAFSFRMNPGIDPKRAFLEHVRRLEILDEEKQLRQLPAAASDVDAVRVMTVHAAKGLQFPMVHILSMTARHFPFKRTDPDQPPPGLVDSNLLMSPDAEEESLFFVAMSRARDGLYISRAINNGGGNWMNVKPSPFLYRITEFLSKHPGAPAGWIDEGKIEPCGPLLQPPEKPASWSARTIETYIDCPRRFYYSEVLQLNDRDSATPYGQFQLALHTTLGWLRAIPSSKERQAVAPTRLAEDWERMGPRGHAFENIYRRAAEKMIATAVQLMDGVNLPLEVSLALNDNVVVTCRADHISSNANRIVVRRLKAGRLSKDEKTKARYVIMQAALQQEHPGLSVEFEHVSLLTGEQRRATTKVAKLGGEINKLHRAITDINAGHFDPTPSDYNCPRCPFYFICPSHTAIAGRL